MYISLSTFLKLQDKSKGIVLFFFKDVIEDEKETGSRVNPIKIPLNMILIEPSATEIEVFKLCVSID